MRVLYLLLFVYGGCAQIITDENHFRLPPLFHLDDYERCLSQKDGLYCLGVIQLTPKKGSHDVYTLMKFMFTIGVVFITYMLSFLLTILVEIPMRRVVGELMLKQLMPK